MHMDIGVEKCEDGYKPIIRLSAPELNKKEEVYIGPTTHKTYQEAMEQARSNARIIISKADLDKNAEWHVIQ